MAKSKSILRLQGTLENLTFVESVAYGNHVRSKRGSKKEATVNDSFKKESKRLVGANVPAKIFNDAIAPYRDELTGGLFWQRLVSMFKKQIKETNVFDFTKLPPFEIHAEHTFNQFLTVDPIVKLNKKKNILTVSIDYSHHPEFKVSPKTNGYKFKLIGIFPNVKKKTAKSCSEESAVISLEKKVSPLTLQLDIPANAKCYIICLKIDGCTNGTINRMRSTQGLRAIAFGAI